MRAGGLNSAVPAALAAGCLLLTGCQRSPESAASGSFHPHTPGVLTIATDEVPTPGLFEGTASNPTGGFEFELATDLAQRFKLRKVRVVTVPFARLTRGDLNGADLALALLTPTTTREQALDFSDPYLDPPPVVLARRGVEVPDLQRARTLRWVVQQGSTLERALYDQIEPTTPVRRVAAQSRELALLRAGKADAALLDLPQAVALATRSAGALHVTAKLEQPEEIAAALPKGSSNDQAVSSAIRALVANGTIDSLATRWLGPAAASSGAGIPILMTSR